MACDPGLLETNLSKELGLNKMLKEPQIEASLSPVSSATIEQIIKLCRITERTNPLSLKSQILREQELCVSCFLPVRMFLMFYIQVFQGGNERLSLEPPGCASHHRGMADGAVGPNGDYITP